MNNLKEIKIGDTIRVRYDSSGSPVLGKEGKVVSITPWKAYPLLVEFDGGRGFSFRGKYRRQFALNEIEKVQTQKTEVYDLKIIAKEDHVIAILKDGETTKKGIAKCHPDDKFDMVTGLQIALSRLFNKPLPLTNGTELDKVNIHGVVSGAGVSQTIELHANNQVYKMPVKVETN